MLKSSRAAKPQEISSLSREDSPASDATLWFPVARVARGGSWEAAGFVSGGPCIEEHPDVIALAGRFLSFDHPGLQFVKVTGKNTWLGVRFTRESGQWQGTEVLISFRQGRTPYNLTVRELDVLTLMAAGFANPEIGRRLSVCTRTVAKHAENLFLKLQVKNRARAGMLALERGLIRIPTPGGFRQCGLLSSKVESGIPEKPLSGGASPVGKARVVALGLPLPNNKEGMDDAVEMFNGAELAVSEINARGGILGTRIRLLTAEYDFQSPESSQTAYSYLLNQDVAGISAGYSCVETAVHGIVGEYGAPYLHTAAMDYIVARVRNSPARLGNIFQACASDVKYGPGLARFALETERVGAWRPHARRMAVVIPGWPGLDLGLGKMERILATRRWEIKIFDGPQVLARNWPEVMSDLGRYDPSVVALASYLAKDGAEFQRAFMRNPLQALVYMIYAPSVPGFMQELESQAEGVVWATTSGSYADWIGSNFMTRYRKRFGKPAGKSHASLSYDCVNLLANAWLRAGDPRKFTKVAGELRTMVHRGVNGAYFLGSEGQVGLAYPDDTLDPSISQAHLVFQVQDASHTILSPTPYSSGQFRRPPWLCGKRSGGPATRIHVG